MKDTPRTARAYDLFMAPLEMALIGRWRRRLWREVSGPRVLEIGCGTGASMRYYPPGIRIAALDRSRSMLDRFRRRQPPRDVVLAEGDAAALPFPDDAFDEAVSSFVFCSVDNPGAVLRELYRVLRPGGRVHMLEHGRSRGRLGRVMDRVAEPLYRMTGDHIARDTAQEAARAGFADVHSEPVLLDVVRIVRARKGDPF